MRSVVPARAKISFLRLVRRHLLARLHGQEAGEVKKAGPPKGGEERRNWRWSARWCSACGGSGRLLCLLVSCDAGASRSPWQRGRRRPERGFLEIGCGGGGDRCSAEAATSERGPHGPVDAATEMQGRLVWLLWSDGGAVRRRGDAIKVLPLVPQAGVQGHRLVLRRVGAVGRAAAPCPPASHPAAAPRRSGLGQRHPRGQASATATPSTCCAPAASPARRTTTTRARTTRLSGAQSVPRGEAPSASAPASSEAARVCLRPDVAEGDLTKIFERVPAPARRSLPPAAPPAEARSVGARWRSTRSILLVCSRGTRGWSPSTTFSPTRRTLPSPPPSNPSPPTRRPSLPRTASPVRPPARRRTASSRQWAGRAASTSSRPPPQRRREARTGASCCRTCPTRSEPRTTPGASTRAATTTRSYRQPLAEAEARTAAGEGTPPPLLPSSPPLQVHERVIERIMDIVGLPQNNAEHMQLLKRELAER